MDWSTSMNSSMVMSQASIWFDQHGFVGKPASLLSLSMTQRGWNQHLRTKKHKMLSKASLGWEQARPQLHLTCGMRVSTSTISFSWASKAKPLLRATKPFLFFLVDEGLLIAVFKIVPHYCFWSMHPTKPWFLTKPLLPIMLSGTNSIISRCSHSGPKILGDAW